MGSKVRATIWRTARRAASISLRILYERPILVVTLLFVVSVAGILWYVARLSSDLVQTTALHEAQAYTDVLREFRTLYTSEVIVRLEEHGIPITHDYEKQPGAIPLPVTLSMKLAQELGDKGSGTRARLYSDYPFPWRKDGGPRDDFERQALDQLRERPDEPFYRFEEFEGRRSLRYAVADRMRSRCINCHNSHPQSPKTDWKEGDVRGVLEAIQPLDAVVAQANAGLQRTFGLLTAMVAAGLMGLSLAIRRLRRTSTDLSEQVARLHESSDALAQSEEKTRSIVETAHDAFVAMDADGRIIDWNPQAEAIFGWSREEAIGRVLAETIIPPQYRNLHQHGLKRFLTTGEGPVLNKRIEITALRRDGREFPVELTISPIRWNQGYVFNAFLHDITERKSAEMELQRAKSDAEVANEAKGQFLAHMSHEIRTPLNGILGMTGLALDTPLTREQRDYLAIVKSSADALLNVVDDILDFSKIEAGKMDFEEHDFDLRRCLDETSKMLDGRARQKGLTLTWLVESGVPNDIRGDAARLQQILINLVGNAIKFTDQGRVDVRVEVANENPDSAVLRFAISDTGVGIPPEKQQAIFRPFEQGDRSMARRFGGTGLGLAIASRLIELMDGHIWVDSEVGKGSTFRFTAGFGRAAARAPLPASDPPAEEDSAPRNGRSAGNGRHLRILLAEDNPVNQRLAARILEKHGHYVTLAANGKEALAILYAAPSEEGGDDARRFDAVLMDVQMPEMDGLEATAAIRARESDSGGHMPIIAVTAHAMKGDRERCLAAGMDGYVAKPIQIEELLRVLHDVVPETAGASA